MQRQYAADGLVCMTIDAQLAELTAKDRVLGFLAAQGATFPNYIFNDDVKKVNRWAEKYHADITPAKVLFDRKGEWVRLPEEYDHAFLEGKVRELLAAE